MKRVSTHSGDRSASPRAWTVWRFTDGKRGHDNQSLGLVNALAQRVGLSVYAVPTQMLRRTLFDLLRNDYSPARALPAPDLLIGAGHATHLPMLAARRARGGRVVVLMKPTLPLGCFDLCIIPEHDCAPERANVLRTRGVLNNLVGSVDKDSARGLILVGGPSSHYDWDQAGLVEQVAEIVGRDERQWTLTTSRRTPSSSLEALRSLAGARLEVVAGEQTGPEWLPEHLARASVVWVTEDSVSMVYEALTAGAATGLLHVPARGPSRIRRGLQSLIAEGTLVPFDQWRRGRALTAAAQPLDEAGRCARWIEKQWLNP